MFRLLKRYLGFFDLRLLNLWSGRLFVQSLASVELELLWDGKSLLDSGFLTGISFHALGVAFQIILLLLVSLDDGDLAQESLTRCR